MNIEIIPNWHPIFVHFTIALLSISALFYLAGLITKKDVFYTVGKWNLWVGALITVGTVIAGLQAAGTVDHDAQSHAAMMNHRNWALGTASVFAVLAAWSVVGCVYVYLGQSGPAKAKAVLSFLSRDGAVW